MSTTDLPAKARQNRIRVLTVDDHAVLRDGIGALVSSQPDMEVVGEAGTGAEAVEAFKRLAPDIALVDLALPDITGIEAIRQIRAAFPSARVIVLTTFRGDVQILRSLQAGASGYLLKSMLRKELVEAIRVVKRGGKYIPAELSGEVAAFASADSLSDREVEVLQLVALGCSNKVLAGRLQISEDTVKSHMRSILSKLGANDRTHAVTIATRRGFLDLRD